MDVLGYCTDIIRGYVNRRHGRHSGVASPIANHRLNEFARSVIHRNFRAKKVGTALLAAAKISAVARTAVNTIESVSA